MTATASRFEPDEAEALDAYSAAVTEVARRLIPSVAFVAVRGPGGRRPEGAGSAVGDQPRRSPAHLRLRGGACLLGLGLVDGAETHFEVVGRDPRSVLAEIHASKSEIAASRSNQG